MISATNSITQWEVQSHYDDLDEIYRSLWGQHLHHGLWISGDEDINRATLQLIDLIAERADIQSEQRICDIGCGYGGTAKYLAEIFNARVVGVTITPRQFEVARRLRPLVGEVEFRLENWLFNSLPDEVFDHTIAIESSEHAVDKSKYFQEAFRVLKDGGKITLCAWMSSENPGPFQKKHLLVPICNEGRLPSLYSISEYQDVLREVGFRIQCTEDLTDKVKKTWSLVLGRTLRFMFSSPMKFLSMFRNVEENQDFLWTPLRMWLAYQTGALRYVLISAQKATGPSIDK